MRRFLGRPPRPASETRLRAMASQALRVADDPPVPGDDFEPLGAQFSLFMAARSGLTAEDYDRFLGMMIGVPEESKG